MSNQTIDECLFELKKQIEIASGKGLRGKQMSQRIKDDLMRLMNSAWLNLADYSADMDCNSIKK